MRPIQTFDVDEARQALGRRSPHFRRAKKWIGKKERAGGHVRAARPGFRYRLSLHSMNDLLQLPTELVVAIFREACADGGFTAVTLSATSRHTRTIVAPFLYETVALVGCDALSSFTRLVMQRSGAPPLVKHLLIRDQKPPRGLRLAASASSTVDGAVDKDPRGELDWSFPHASPVQSSEAPRALLDGLGRVAIQGDLTALLDDLSATLVHLTLVISTWHPSFALAPACLPALTELTCWFKSDIQPCARDPLQPYTYASWLAGERALLPALQRLHVLGSNLMCTPYCMQTVPRQITHLRLSNEANVEYMVQLISDPRLDRLPRFVIDEGTWLPPTLAHILLQSSQTSAQYIPRARFLIRRLREAGHPMGKALTLIKDGGGHTFLHVYQDWLDRALSTGSGCWRDVDSA
jgi:hypothetical protein